MAWTEAQRAAIETGDKNLLVAAAAGSGKTAVLVERIIRKLIAGEWEVDRLLVVTFTHAAAEEMSGRIEAALRQALLCEKDDDKLARLERQAVLLSGAAIATLHSFCQRVIREHFMAIDLDPQFRIGNEQELNLLKRDILEELFEQKYAAGEESFLEFADGFGGNAKGDDKLYQLVLRLYEFARSQPFPEKWLHEQAKIAELTGVKSLNETPWYEAVLSEVQMNLAAAQEDAAIAAEAAEKLGVATYLSALQGEMELIESLRETAQRGDWSELYQAFQKVAFGKLPAARGLDEATKEALEAQVKTPRNRYKKAVAAIKETYFAGTEESLLEDLRQAAPAIQELIKLTREFGEAYAQEKKKKLLADFNDLEHFTLQILCQGEEPDGKLTPSQVALALREQYQTVMVDEYQDTNGVQEAIVNLVADPDKANLFTVGDVKQSIYRFRLADPSLFLHKYVSYPQLGEKYARIDLAQNFRSRPEVLAAVNFIFTQVMNQASMEIAYDEAAALHPGADYPLCEGESLKGPAEFALIYKDEETEEEAEPEGKETPEPFGAEDAPPADASLLAGEGEFIAARIKAMLQAKTQVFDKNTKTYRPMEFRDIVILLRSARENALAIMEVLRRHNIPAYSVTDSGYFAAQEIKVMLSLLSALDNARQDIPLAAVLASPIGGFTTQELAEIRLAAPEEDYYTALLKSGSLESETRPELREKAAAFMTRLTGWRKLAQEISVPELIWQLYRDTGYYDYVGGLPGGLLRQANLRMLVDRAAEYEATSFRGLFRFLRFVEKMHNMSTDLAEARTLGEKEDVVRLMTIHKSKGLEFPLVFVAGLGRGFNLRDAADTVLLHRKLGIGAYRQVEDAPLSYATFAWHAIAAQIIQESKAEELRVLYVALTRAREKLILVGSTTAKKLPGKIADWCRYNQRGEVRLPPHAPLKAVSFLDWVGMAVARHPEGEALWSASVTGEAPASLVDYRDESHWQVSLLPLSDFNLAAAPKKEDKILAAVEKAEKLPDTKYREAVQNILNWRYPDSGAASVPAKLSITELKRRLREEDTLAGHLMPEQIPWRRPRFLQPGKFTGAEYGTIMHTVMQHLDLRGTMSAAAIKKQVAVMVEREHLLPAEAETVNTHHIAGFFRSELGKRLRAAQEYWRELPFSRLVSAKEFYPEVKSAEEKLFVQGVIDLLFAEGDSLVLVDYKTDADTNPEKMRERYRLQVSLYSQAVEEILGRPVKERYLFMLHDGSAVAI